MPGNQGIEGEVALIIVTLCLAWGICASYPHYLAAALPSHDD